MGVLYLLRSGSPIILLSVFVLLFGVREIFSLFSYRFSLALLGPGSFPYLPLSLIPLTKGPDISPPTPNAFPSLGVRIDKPSHP